MIWNEIRKERLWKRQEIIRTIREDLYNEGFLEAETPLLIKGTCPDLYIDSIEAKGGYLATSTEYQIKRMMQEGFDKVFTLTKNFRENDVGRYHSQEFTMLEWGRAGVLLDAIEEDAERFIQKISPSKPFKKLTVREAFSTYLGLDDLEDFSLHPLLNACKRASVALPDAFLHDKYMLISFLFEKLQSHLGHDIPTFLRDWPAYLTTSAPLTVHDPTVADRSELYIKGIEIADGFPFLQDAAFQRQLFEHEQSLRVAIGKKPVQLDEKFLDCLARGMPSGAGMALGVDRLVMVLTGATSLAEVQAFSQDEL